MLELKKTVDKIWANDSISAQINGSGDIILTNPLWFAKILPNQLKLTVSNQWRYT